MLRPTSGYFNFQRDKKNSLFSASVEEKKEAQNFFRHLLQIICSSSDDSWRREKKEKKLNEKRKDDVSVSIITTCDVSFNAFSRATGASLGASERATDHLMEG